VRVGGRVVSDCAANSKNESHLEQQLRRTSRDDGVFAAEGDKQNRSAGANLIVIDAAGRREVWLLTLLE